MDQLTKYDLLKLAKPQRSYVVSIYLPTQKATGADVRQNRIRFKNLINNARWQLELLGTEQHLIKKQLEPAERLLMDEDFWRHQNHGLAAFFSRRKSLIYRLPVSVTETCIVAKRYHLKQLLHVLNADKTYHLLTISPDKVKLFEITRSDIKPLKQSGIPADITEALGTDDNERQVQHHFGGPAGMSGRSAIFHGHGGAKDLRKIDLERFVHDIAHKVGDRLKRSEIPLVIAGTEEITSLYRQNYPNKNLHPKHLHGNYDNVEAERLHKRLLTLLAAEFEEDTAGLLAQHQELAATRPGLTASNLEDVIESAHQGRIGTLLVNKEATCWGEVNGNEVKRHEHEQKPGLSDLGDIAAAIAFQTSSEIHLIEPDAVPAHTPALAILRY